MNDYFARLGRVIDRRWSAAHRDDEALALIAAEALVEAIVRRRFGAESDALLAALDEAARVAEVDAVRAELTSDEDRFVASLMLCATTRAQALALTRQRMGDDPVARLASWPERSGLFAETDRAPIEATRAMADSLARWCRRSIYAPLIAEV